MPARGRDVGLPAQPPRREPEGTELLAAPPGDSALDRGEAVPPMVPPAPRVFWSGPRTLTISEVALSPSHEPHDPCRWHKRWGRAEDLHTPARLGAGRHGHAPPRLTPPTCPSGILDWVLPLDPAPSCLSDSKREDQPDYPELSRTLRRLVYLHSNRSFSWVWAQFLGNFQEPAGDSAGQAKLEREGLMARGGQGLNLRVGVHL